MSTNPHQNLQWNLQWSHVKKANKNDLLAFALCLGVEDCHSTMKVQQLKYMMGKCIMEKHCVLGIPLETGFWKWMCELNPDAIADETEAIKELFPDSLLAKTLKDDTRDANLILAEMPTNQTDDIQPPTFLNVTEAGHELIVLNEATSDTSSTKGGGAESRQDTPVTSGSEESNGSNSFIMEEHMATESPNSKGEKSFYSCAAEKKEMEKMNLLIENQNQLIQLQKLMLNGNREGEK